MPSTVAVVGAPANGTAVPNGNGAVAYTPAFGFTGSDTFTYTVADAQGAVSNQAMVTVTINAVSAETVIDNGGPGTSFTGTWAASGATGSYGSPSVWSRDGTKYTWTFTPFTSGSYELSMWWTAYSSRSTSVPVDIRHTGGTTRVTINQQQNGGRWNVLGRYTFAAGQSYTVTITSQPGPSSTSADAVKFSFLADVGNLPPTAVNDTAATSMNTPVTVDVISNDTDDTGINAATVAIVTPPANGTAVPNGNGTVTYTPVAGFTGADTFRYTVADGQGAVSNQATVTVTINAVSAETVVDNGGPGTSFTGTWAVSGATGSYGSPSVWSRDGSKYRWTFVPAVTGNYQLSMWWTAYSSRSTSVPVDVQHSGGTTRVTINQKLNGGKWNGLGIYSLIAGTSYTVTVTSQPGPSSTSADAVKFSYLGGGSNFPPTAWDDSATTTEGVPVTVNVISNDTDDIGINTASVAIVTSPVAGTAVSNGDGTVMYTPAGGFTGVDTFTYTVADTQGAVSNTATATVTVNAQNVPPTARDDFATTSKGALVTINVISNDTDDVGIDGATVAVVISPTNGSVSPKADGTVTYTPGETFTGVDTFAYTVADTQGAVSNVATVAVTVKAENDPPTAWDDSATTTEGVPVTVNVLSNDTDDIGLNTASVAIVTSPVTGTAIPKGDGTVMYTPAGGFTGVDTFTYTVADTQGAVSNTAAVAVTVNAGGGGSPPDVQPPYTTSHSPAKGATNVPISNRTISLHIKDDRTDDDGIVQSSIAITAEGAGGTEVITGTTSDFTVSYTRGSDWAYDQEINVIVTATDSAGNVLNESYSFYTATASIPPLTITTTSLPSAILGNSYSATLSAMGGATPYLWYSTTPDTGLIHIINQRYLTDSFGIPKFLLGYYAWTTAELDIPQDAQRTVTGRTMIETDMGPNKLNYMRFSLGLDRSTSSTYPTSYDGTPNLVPFLYSGSPAKADLDQWDSDFWSALKELIADAEAKGIIVHVAFFDGACSMQASKYSSWNDSFWNIDNQKQSYFGDLDKNGNGKADEDGEFYQKTAFDADTGVGYYQRRLIAKTITELDGFTNVMYEVGNETFGAPANWLESVISYGKTLTAKPIAINIHSTQTKPSDPGMFVDHTGNTLAIVKSDLSGMVGKGYPAMIDPDGSAFESCAPADCRKAAWYSLAGGAAGWGGFYRWQTSRNIDVPKYYGFLQNFLTSTGARFWTMVPHNELITNSTYNSMIANPGDEYLMYSLSDASVDITLERGTYSTKYIDATTGVITTGDIVSGDGVSTLNKPVGASDWAVFLKNETASVLLPPGLSLNSGGLISGISASTGTYEFPVGVMDAVNTTATKNLSITVDPKPITDNTITIASIADTFINSGDNTVNYFTDNTIIVYVAPADTVADRIIMQVDISSIPDNVTITNSTLNIYLGSHQGSGGDNPMRMRAYRISGTLPAVSTVTWDNFTGTLESYESETNVPLTAGWVQVDITKMMQYAYENSVDLYLALDAQGVQDTNRTFYSADYPTSTLRPEVVVNYVYPVGP